MSERDDLERDMRAASVALSAGGKGNAAQGTENKYGEAYQALVRAGYRPQLRKKYRR